MEILPIEFFGVAIEVAFPSPLGFTQARLEDFGAKVCDATKGIGLRVDQIRLRRTDELYNYELSAQFFGENGSLSRTAASIKLAIRNARNNADWNLIRETFVRFYNLMEFLPTSVTALSTHVHAKCDSLRDRDDFLSQFDHGANVIRAAGLGYVRIADWEKEIRVLIENSNAVQDGLFVAWDTQFTNSQDWDSFLYTLPTMMENSANIFGLGFEPLKQA
jgi:hypothetical protein